MFIINRLLTIHDVAEGYTFVYRIHKNQNGNVLFKHYADYYNQHSAYILISYPWLLCVLLFYDRYHHLVTPLHLWYKLPASKRAPTSRTMRNRCRIAFSMLVADEYRVVQYQRMLDACRFLMIVEKE